MSASQWAKLLCERIRVVLVRPSIAGNIGATARIMRNFGLEQMYLVRPHTDPLDLESRKLSTQGESILHRARSVGALAEAVADCGLVLATSARVGGLLRRDMVTTPRQAAQRAWESAASGAVAWVFGPEQTGLSNQEITCCHYLVHIPADAGYPVLNLAQAVAICLYEQFQVASGGVLPVERRPIAPWELQERMFQHLRQALEEIHFLWGDRADYLMHGLRHLLGRAAPNQEEVDMLMGLARQIRWYVRQYGPNTEKAKPPETVPDNAANTVGKNLLPAPDCQQSAPDSSE